jgi:hypothetical protein
MVGWWHRWRVAILSTAGLAVVIAQAFGTGYMSWGHIVHVGLSVREPSAGLLPVAVDGMMVTGAIMAWVDRIRGYKARAWSIVALWFGSWLTLAFNVMSAYERGLLAMVVAAIPAAAFLVTVESVFHPSTRILEMAVEAVAKAVDAPVPPVSVETPPVPPSEAPEVPTAEDAPVRDKPPRPRPKRKRPPRTTISPGVRDRGNIIDATIVEPRDTAVVPVFVGPPMADPEADMG